MPDIHKSKNYKKNDILMNNMVRKSKYQIYQIAKFIILSVLLIYGLYFKMHIPLTLVLILEILLFIKVLPITKFVEERIVKCCPKYNNFNIWIKRLILFGFYILIFIILKFIIVNIIMIKILNIPVEQQIYDFINKTAK